MSGNRGSMRHRSLRLSSVQLEQIRLHGSVHLRSLHRGFSTAGFFSVDRFAEGISSAETTAEDTIVEINRAPENPET